MRRIKSKGMLPELAVRRLVHSMGYRFRLHVRTLPGKPDLVFAKYKKIIDVRGCFWHQHGRCSDSRMPKSRVEYWRPKLRLNQKRDEKNTRQLAILGWKVLVIWECEVQNAERLRRSVSQFLS
jgi:DNA mismatch endonuclease (patch repair protein)